MSASRFIVILLGLVHFSVVCCFTVKQCCPPNHYYVPQNDSCSISSKTKITSKFADIDDSISLFGESITAKFTEELAACPPGQTAKVTVKFRLLADGSVQGTDANNETFKPSDFCLARGDPRYEEQKWFLRLCVPDPCAEGKACVRKCCPRGFVYVLRGENSSAADGCVPYEDKPFVPPLWQQRDGNFSISVKEAAGPVCQRFLLDPSQSQWDQFAVMPDNGHLRYCPTPHVEHHKDYCVDHFMYPGDFSRLSMMAVVCLVESSKRDYLFLQIYPYVMFATSFFTFATVLVYLIVPKLRNLHGKNIICHVTSVTVTYVLLGLVQVEINYVMEGILCKLIAVTIHFSFISCFTWLNVLSFSMCRALTKLKPKKMVDNSQRRNKRRFIFYSIYGWGVPLIIVAVGQIVELFAVPCSGLVSPRFGTLKCWFADDAGLVYYLYGPIGCMIVTNILLFCITAVAYWKASNAGMLAAKSARTKQRFRVVLGLFLLMGVTWILEVLSFAIGGSSHNWIAPDLFNILTGVFIFLMFVCKPEVGRLLKERFSELSARFCGRGDHNESTITLRQRSSN